ncbi:MAG: glycosyltransferase family 4 protein [Saprospiraceae bacterium]
MKLSFYTNIPTPYQDDFFKALARQTDFEACYFARTESDRSWGDRTVGFHEEYLSNGFFAKMIQRRFKDFHFSLGIFRRSLKEDADFIILGGNYFALNNFFAAMILKSRGKRLGFFSERIGQSKGLKGLVKKIYLNLFLHMIDVLILIGQTARQSYSRLGFTDINSVIVPYSIDPSPYQNAVMDSQIRDAVRLRLNCSDKFTCLVSGALIERKGVDLAIRTMNMLELKYPDKFCLIILGGGPLEALYREMSGTNIHFEGFQQKDELPSYFAAADVFLFPTRYDGWGLVVNEAISAGLPIICSANAGASEYIKEGVNGFIVHDEELTSYATLLERLFHSDSLRSTIRQNNLLLSRAISSDAMAEQLLGAIKRLSS